METLKNLFKRKVADKSEKAFPEDLKKIIIEHQNLKERIKGIEMNMSLVASDRNQRHVLDDVLKKKCNEKAEIICREIFDLCAKYGIDSSRFLSVKEIDRFQIDDAEEKTA